MRMNGNVYLDGARPSKFDGQAVIKPGVDPGLRMETKSGGEYLKVKYKKTWTSGASRELVTSASLGKAAIPDLPYEQPDGAPLRIDTDYFGKSRDESNPTPGPFERPGFGDLNLKLW
jgi:alpha-N-arabinofuranosidase